MQSISRTATGLSIGASRVRSARAERYGTIRRFFVAQAEAEMSQIPGTSNELRRIRTLSSKSSERADRPSGMQAGLRNTNAYMTRTNNPGSEINLSWSLSFSRANARFYSTARPPSAASEDQGQPSKNPARHTSSTNPSQNENRDPPPSSPPQNHPPPPDHSYYAPFIRRLLKRVPQTPFPSPQGTHTPPHPSTTPYQIRPETNSLTPPHLFDPASISSAYPTGSAGGRRTRPPTYQQPTKAELLAASTSVWQRLLIRWRWFSIRGWRRFNVDEWSAFLSWFVVGNTIWIIIGTTTFFSAVFATLNSLSLQSYVGRWLSDYLTKNTGFNVIFESAIVPKWGASTISFRNVYVSRRPIDDEIDDEEVVEKDAGKVSAGGRMLQAVRHRITAYMEDGAVAKAAAEEQLPVENDKDGVLAQRALPVLSEEEEDDARLERLRQKNNYTMFDLNFDEVEVTFSLPRLLDGKGLIKDAKIRGVRGVVDRRHVFWDPNVPLVPANFRHPTKHGDFELESLMVEDFLVTVYQPGGQRPFNVSFFTAAIGAFRKRWMFYDLMSADGITGQYDNCLFSLHKPQKLGKTLPGEDLSLVKRLARFRVDGLPIEHAQYATGFTGPMAWLNSGKIDAVLDIQFPSHPDDEVDLGVIMEHLGRSMTDLAKETGKELGLDDMHNPFAGAKLAGWTSQIETAEPSWPRWGTLREDETGQTSDKRWSGRPSSDSTALDVAAAAETAQSAIVASKAASEDRGIIPGQHRLARPALRAPDSVESAAIIRSTAASDSGPPLSSAEAAIRDALRDREVKIDIDLRFRDLKASVPMYTTDLTMRNNAFIRPIVAFINANRTLIPIHCTVKAPLSDFDGSWTLFETGLTSTISQQIHAALIHHVSSSSANQQRIRTVGTWGVQRGAEAVLNVLRTVVDPMHTEMQAVVTGV